jgi:3'(2'), 5'-bisphosphate nucleotidase
VDLHRELEVAIRLALEAGALIRGFHASGIAVDRKAGNEPVTQADRDANALLVAGLSAAFPDYGMLSEEAPDDGTRLTRERVWMIDPIDGTQDFIRGDSGFATMIGLLDGELPALGVVYQPLPDRLYFATRWQGAFCREGTDAPVRLYVSTVSDPADIRMVASKSHREEVIDRVRDELGIRDELNVGSVGLKLGLIARGDRDLYVNPSGHSKLWDTCGPQAILDEAGGRVSDSRGAPLLYRGAELANLRGLIASNARLHEEVIARLAKLFGA